MAETILSKRAPVYQVLLLIFYSLPTVVALSAPFATLVGTLMFIGRITTDNEILAMRSAGLSYRTLFIPVLIVGLGISIVSFVVNDVFLPAGTLQFGKLYKEILLSTPEVELKSDTIKHFKNTSIIIGAVNGREIKDLLILDLTAAGDHRIISATSAQLEEGDNSSLILDLNNAFVYSSKENAVDNYDYSIAKVMRYVISGKNLSEAIITPGPREMSSVDVAKDIREKKVAVNKRLHEMKDSLSQTAREAELALRRTPKDPLWNELETRLNNFSEVFSNMQRVRIDSSLSIYQLEYYKKFSIPFGSLSFIFLATPLGLFARKSGQSVGFGIGLFIAILYWAMLIGGQTLGIRFGYSPFWVIWFPNMLVIGSGIILSITRIFK